MFTNLGGILQGDIVGNISKVIGYKCFLNCECNCNPIIKLGGRCSYGGECTS